MEDLKIKLEKFGKVEQCEIIGKQTHIKITEGFLNNSKVIFPCQDIILKYTKGRNLGINIAKFRIEENLFHLILKA